MDDQRNEPSCETDDVLSVFAGFGTGPSILIQGEELCIEFVFTAELLDDPDRFHKSMSSFLDDARDIIVERDLVGLQRAMLSSLVEHLRKWPYHEILSARGYKNER